MGPGEDDYDPIWEEVSDHLWVLDDRLRPQLACLRDWAVFMETDRRLLRQEHVEDIYISTVFLGTCCSGPPLLFETMAFGGALDQIQRRYTSAVEALIGHEQIKAEVVACLRRAKEINTTPHAN